MILKAGDLLYNTQLFFNSVKSKTMEISTLALASVTVKILMFTSMPGMQQGLFHLFHQKKVQACSTERIALDKVLHQSPSERRVVGESTMRYRCHLYTGHQ